LVCVLGFYRPEEGSAMLQSYNSATWRQKAAQCSSPVSQGPITLLHDIGTSTNVQGVRVLVTVCTTTWLHLAFCVSQATTDHHASPSPYFNLHAFARTRCASGSASCVLCPPGYYCDSSCGVVVINNTITCPVGHYCQQGGSTYLSHSGLVVTSGSIIMYRLKVQSLLMLWPNHGF
jgi:hypothetical protein